MPKMPKAPVNKARDTRNGKMRKSA